MSYRVTLLSGSDTPYAGLPLQLMRGETVVARTATDAAGMATFDYTAAAGESLSVHAAMEGERSSSAGGAALYEQKEPPNGGA